MREAVAFAAQRLTDIAQGEVLAIIATTLQVQPPPEAAVAVYLELLDRFSAYAWRCGTIDLLSTHAWPRFPYPADFVSKFTPHQEWIESFDRTLSRAAAFVPARERAR